MPLPREQRICMAYDSVRARFKKEGFYEIHFKSMVHVAKLFNLNILQVSAILRKRREAAK